VAIGERKIKCGGGCGITVLHDQSLDLAFGKNKTNVLGTGGGFGDVSTLF